MDNGRIVSKPLDNMHHPLRSGQTLGERIVLTSSFPGQIQATTVQQYLEQFWPDNSERLLGVIQRAFSEERDNSEYPPMFCYIREPTICVELSDSDLVVSFTGGCFLSVVELAEQLAWLSAATQASLGSTFEGPPSVYLEAKKSIDDPAYLLRSRWDLRLGRLPFDATDHSLTLLHQLRSHGTLLRLAPPLITGFRTAHRPNNDLGVEVPSHLLLDIVTPQEEFRVEGGGVFLCGKNLTLRLMKKVDDVLVWHVSSSVRVCACQLHYHPTLSKKEISRLDLSALKQFRHIIGLCHTAGASSGEDSQSRSSWETSLETDELSSELSEDELIAMTGPDEALSPFVDAVARRLLDEHRRATARQQAATRVLSPGTHGEAPKDTHGSSLRLAHGSDQQRSRSFCKGKGRAAKDQGQDSDDEGSRRRQPKKLRLNDPPPKGKPKQLACHFWKLNPRAHRSCFRFTLEDTSRVKQHLKRKHTPEYYCERCWAIFPDHGTHQTHVKVKVVTCPSRTCNFPEITYRQREALRIRSTSNTEEGRWFDMWDIIFPGSPRPPSPYIESDLSEELCELMEFAPAHGPAIMAAEIQASIQEWGSRDTIRAARRVLAASHHTAMHHADLRKMVGPTRQPSFSLRRAHTHQSPSQATLHRRGPHKISRSPTQALPRARIHQKAPGHVSIADP